MTYESPFSLRYGSREMKALFSSQKKFSTWRQIWVALAEAQKEVGLAITDSQIVEMKEQIDTIDFARAEQFEKELRHDVMAHIQTFGTACPTAKPIIHLGATSCLVTDNAEVLIMQSALKLIETKLHKVIASLAKQADRYKSCPCMSYTHFQPAQPTTVGKRFTIWLQDFCLDEEDLQYRQNNLRFLGIKGSTGTQASFLELFEGDHDKVKELERRMTTKLGFCKTFPISGQTYTRKQDTQILELLSGIATSAHKMATDLRLLSHLKEIEEPFGKHQVGSSAMPYKRNPMESERICSLARYAMTLAENPKYTAAVQWLERSLDDSANRRLCIPEAFLTIDTILDSLINLIDNLVIYEKVIEKNLQKELPFLATENILMALVKKGADRQEMHEKLRQLSQQVSQQIKLEGKENTLLEKIAQDPSIPLSQEELNNLLQIKQFIGRAPEQVIEFLNQLKL